MHFTSALAQRNKLGIAVTNINGANNRLCHFILSLGLE